MDGDAGRWEMNPFYADKIINIIKKETLDMEETVTISKKEYNELKEDAAIYQALEAAGVDNWDGWDIAMDILGENEDA